MGPKSPLRPHRHSQSPHSAQKETRPLRQEDRVSSFSDSNQLIAERYRRGPRLLLGEPRQRATAMIRQIAHRRSRWRICPSQRWRISHACIEPRRLARWVAIGALIHLAHPRPVKSSLPSARDRAEQAKSLPCERLGGVFQDAPEPAYAIQRMPEASAVLANRPSVPGLVYRRELAPYRAWRVRDGRLEPVEVPRIAAHIPRVDIGAIRIDAVRVDEQRGDHFSPSSQSLVTPSACASFRTVSAVTPGRCPASIIEMCERDTPDSPASLACDHPSRCRARDTLSETLVMGSEHTP